MVPGISVFTPPPKVRSRISIHERLFLNPFHKYYVYGTFPTKFVLHVLLLVLVTYQVLTYLRKDIKHACHTGQHFSTLFLGRPEGSTLLMHPNDLQIGLRSAIQNIFDIDKVTFNDVTVVVDGVANPEVLPVHVIFRNRTNETVFIRRSSALRRPSDSGDFLEKAMPLLFSPGIRHVEDISFSFSLHEKMLLPLNSVPAAETFFWVITVDYDGSNVGRFAGRMSYRMGTDGKLSSPCLWANVSILVAAFLSLLLVVKRATESLQVLLVLRRGTQAGSASTGVALTLSEQLALFNWWWVVSALSHMAQLVATAGAMARTSDVSWRFCLLGWSSCLTWLNICQYFESFPGYYVTFSTTSQGARNVFKYMASVFPILTAFMFLGTCNFWKAQTFQDASATYASLFSLLNGDMVHDSFNDVGGIGGWAGYLYVYIFIIVFIYIVLNVNITIIEEAYYAARNQGLKHDAQHTWDRLRSFSEHPSCQSLTDMAESGFRGSSAGLCASMGVPLLPRCPSPILETERGEAGGAVQQDAMQGAAAPAALAQTLLPLRAVADRGVATPASVSPAATTTHPGRSPSGTNILETTEPDATGRSPTGSGGGSTPFRRWRRGSMSPRLLENPRLSGALSAAFPRQASDGVLLATPRPGVPFGLDATRPAGGDCNTAAAIGSEAAVREFWFSALPRCTESILSLRLPRRSELGEEVWVELERCIAAHTGAVEQIRAALYMESVRT